jgi:hypothetical protein
MKLKDSLSKLQKWSSEQTDFVKIQDLFKSDLQKFAKTMNKYANHLESNIKQMLKAFN